MSSRPWIITEIERLQDHIESLGRQIMNLEQQNDRLRRLLRELRSQQIELILPGLPKNIHKEL